MHAYEAGEARLSHVNAAAPPAWLQISSSPFFWTHWISKANIAMNNATTTGWMPEPQGRGTIGLVWSCLATIFICVWSALHLNLPADGDGAFERMFDQAVYAVIGLLAPEWLSYVALGDLESAWEMMSQWPKTSLKECFFIRMGGVRIHTVSRDGTRRIRVVDCRDLRKLIEDGTVERPQIKCSDIDDQTQGDKLVKAIAVLQIFWFFAQTLGRAINGLAITTLELFTIGNVVCATITYFAWWSKPNGVRVPIVIKGVAPSWVRSCDSVDIDPENGQRKSALAGLFIGLGFGALHLVAWNFQFPSQTERVLWRVSSVGTTALSLILPIRSLFYDYDTETYTFLARLQLSRDLENLLGRGRSTVMFLILASYTLFRIYMLVEMFVALRDVPADVYKTVQWSQYFPAL